MATTVSLIIPTVHRLQPLMETLRSVAPQHSAALEVIVAAQSDDGGQTRHTVTAAFPFVSYRTLKKPNLPAARNLGILESRGDIVLFIDDDVTIHDNFIAAHGAAHQKYPAACIGGRIIQQWAPVTAIAEIDRTTGESHGNFDRLEAAQEIPYACGCNMSFKRDALLNTGLFDQRFTGNALYEEVDLCFRLKKKGYTTLYSPEPVLTHHRHTSGGCHESDQSTYLIQRIHNHALFYFRHISPLPSLPFLTFIKNIAEFASRKKNNSHHIGTLIACVAALNTAFVQARLPLKKPKGHR